MSKRRNSGEFVVKKEHAGFRKESLVLYIPTIEDFKKHGFDYSSSNEDEEGCFMCNDPECKEYANLLIVKDNVVSDEWIYHVSECMMDDYKKE
jgi:hypothetical protein